MINLFYITISILILLLGWVLYLFFNEKFKEISFYFLLFYISIYFLISNIIVCFYIEYLTVFFSILLEENFIVKNPDDWVWAMFTISLLLLFVLMIPYVCFIVYMLFGPGFYRNEQRIIWYCTFLILFCINLTGFLLIKDFIFAGISSLATAGNTLPFEFQFEIESFVFFIYGTFIDFLISVFSLQIIIIIFFSNLMYSKISRGVFWIIICLIYYWFGGVTFIQDFYMLIFTFLVLEFLKWLKIFIYYVNKWQ